MIESYHRTTVSKSEMTRIKSFIIRKNKTNIKAHSLALNLLLTVKNFIRHTTKVLNTHLPSVLTNIIISYLPK